MQGPVLYYLEVDHLRLIQRFYNQPGKMEELSITTPPILITCIACGDGYINILPLLLVFHHSVDIMMQQMNLILMIE